LWENLGYYIIYFIPSKEFILELIETTNWYYWEEKNKPTELFIKSIDLSEWYNIENINLFEYFNSWDDLKYKINNLTQDYILNKKNIIKKFMEESNIKYIYSWKKILKV
jgi:hypothetical protein